MEGCWAVGGGGGGTDRVGVVAWVVGDGEKWLR